MKVKAKLWVQTNKYKCLLMLGITWQFFDASTKYSFSDFKMSKNQVESPALSQAIKAISEKISSLKAEVKFLDEEKTNQVQWCCMMTSCLDDVMNYRSQQWESKYRTSRVQTKAWVQTWAKLVSSPRNQTRQIYANLAIRVTALPVVLVVYLRY